MEDYFNEKFVRKFAQELCICNIMHSGIVIHHQNAMDRQNNKQDCIWGSQSYSSTENQLTNGDKVKIFFYGTGSYIIVTGDRVWYNEIYIHYTVYK